MVPYLKDRPLTLTRFPDGIHGKSFFQKDAPAWRPEWIRTVRVWSEEATRDLEQYVADDLPSLLHVVNLGTIPIHVGAARAPGLGGPDWCSIDLDPKGAPFAHVATLARAIPARRGRVYLDTLQNGSGKTLAAPFCVRPRPGAPVSMPLRWTEVDGRLHPSRFTIRSAPRRMGRLGDDPLLPVLAMRPDLVAALARLRDRLPAT